MNEPTAESLQELIKHLEDEIASTNLVIAKLREKVVKMGSLAGSLRKEAKRLSKLRRT